MQNLMNSDPFSLLRFYAFFLFLPSQHPAACRSAHDGLIEIDAKIIRGVGGENKFLHLKLLYNILP